MSITYRGTDIHTDNIHLEPDFNTLPSVRGKDDILPGAVGRFVRNRINDVLIVPLNGYVKGTGTTDAERAESFRTSVDSLVALLDPSAAPGTLHVPANEGCFAMSESRSVSARVLNAVHGPIIARHYQSWSIDLEAVDDPEWIEGSS